MPTVRAALLDDFRPAMQLRLSALWASLMFCYVYGDYFGLYVPGKLVAMNAGKMGAFGVLTPGMQVAVSLMMAIPSLMIALSVFLPPTLNRWLNLLFGFLYSAIMVRTMVGGAPAFYLVLGVVEVALTLSIMLCAWTWPKVEKPDSTRNAAG